MMLFWCGFIVNFEHISYLFSSASIVEFEQVNVTGVNAVVHDVVHDLVAFSNAFNINLSKVIKGEMSLIPVLLCILKKLYILT